MILFFSATGNTEYAARFVADRLNDEVIDLGAALKSGEALDVTSDKPYVLFTPIYISAIPTAIEKLVCSSRLGGSADMYFVETCAGSGKSAAYVGAKRICKALKKTFKGITHISMPQNYLMYFKTKEKAENDEKFEKALSYLPEIADRIASGDTLDMKKPSLMHRMVASRPVVRLFDVMLVGTKKFRVTDGCVSCGLCEKNCPKNVIHLVDGKPIWNKKGCLHCTACINRCPKKAIEYGKKTLSRPRYYAKKYKGEDIVAPETASMQNDAQKITDKVDVYEE